MRVDSAEHSQRTLARDQLREYAVGRPPVPEIDATVGDLGLAHAVASRNLATSEQDPTGVRAPADRARTPVLVAPRPQHISVVGKSSAQSFRDGHRAGGDGSR
jgi:hypothetical protein